MGLLSSHDDGNCLKQVLCKNNQWKSKGLSGARIWMPVWRYISNLLSVALLTEIRLLLLDLFVLEFSSLGMSWTSSKLAQKPMDSSVVFECLKASTIGLGQGDCHKIFNCDLDRIHHSRSIERQKRSIGDYTFRWAI